MLSCPRVGIQEPYFYAADETDHEETPIFDISRGKSVVFMKNGGCIMLCKGFEIGIPETSFDHA